MRKVFETRLNIVLRTQSRNIFRRLWLRWREAHGAISIASPEMCPAPLKTLIVAARSFLFADIYARVLLEQLYIPGSTIVTKQLPKKTGNGFVSSLLQKSAKGLTVSAKILTKLEGNEVRLLLYAD